MPESFQGRLCLLRCCTYWPKEVAVPTDLRIVPLHPAVTLGDDHVTRLVTPCATGKMREWMLPGAYEHREAPDITLVE